MIPKQELLDDLNHIVDDAKKWNRNPWFPTNYIRALIESHVELYETLKEEET